MPNFCQNQVTIEHDNPAEIKRLFDAFEKGEFLQAIDPMPEHLPALPKGLDSLPNWYNWRVQHWGTKWDVGNDGFADLITDNTLSLSFDTAWAPPIPAFEMLVKQGFRVQAYYHEMGMCFMGEFNDGEDDYLEYDGADDIPENWFDVWNMGEYFAMLEEIEEGG